MNDFWQSIRGDIHSLETELNVLPFSTADDGSEEKVSSGIRSKMKQDRDRELASMRILLTQCQSKQKMARERVQVEDAFFDRFITCAFRNYSAK